MRSPRPPALLRIALLVALAPACGGGGGGGGGGGLVAVTSLASFNSGEANSSSFGSALSSTGRFIAFDSVATNMVPGDTNGVGDVFVRDAQTRVTRRVSLATGAVQAVGGDSHSPAISADGRFVAFTSDATNLVALDGNAAADAFLHDTQTGTTIRVSVGPGGVEANGASGGVSISSTGRFVAFISAATNLVAADGNTAVDVFVHDTQTSTTTRVSVDQLGGDPDGASTFPSISADGLRVAFQSVATDMVAGDGSPVSDVFVRDLQSNTTTRVSVDSSEVPANSFSGAPSISPDGRFVAFESDATNLVAADGNGVTDVFVRDMQAGTTVRVSVGPAGAEADAACSRASISTGGLFVSFDSAASTLAAGDANGIRDVFVRDTAAGATSRASVAWGPAESAVNVADDSALSADGSTVSFSSLRSSLVYGEAATFSSIFVRDLAAGVTRRGSVRTPQGPSVDVFPGTGRPAISSDGTFLAFESAATDLVVQDTNGNVDVFVHAPATFATSRISLNGTTQATGGNSNSPSMTGDGLLLAFSSAATDLVASDSNAQSDVFVRNVATLQTVRVSVATGGAQATGGGSGSPAIAANGRYVAFSSQAIDLVAGDTNTFSDVFVHDLQLGTTTRASVTALGAQATGGGSASPSISADGRYVAFESTAVDLVPGDLNPLSEIFRKDLQTGALLRVSLGVGGVEAVGGGSFNPRISADGRYVAFDSLATNLVAGDTNTMSDVFVHDTQTSTTTRVSVGPSGVQGDLGSSQPSISSDGLFIAFHSDATTLVAGDGNSLRDIFLRDVAAGTTVRVSLTDAGLETMTGASVTPAISGDGRFVAFTSTATDLIPGGTPATPNIFVRGPLR